MTKAEQLLQNPKLLDNAQFVLDEFTKRGGSVSSSFLTSVRSPWREDVLAALQKAAKSPKRFFGSFPLDRCLTWASTLGFTPEAVAAVLLINAGRLRAEGAPSAPRAIRVGKRVVKV